MISTRGILGDEPVDDFIRWMAHAAIMTRSIAESALVLNVLADRNDQDYCTGTEQSNKTVRIGVGNNFNPGAQVKQAFDQAVSLRRSLGYELTDKTVPLDDPGQGNMINIEADRAGIADQAFADVDVIVLSTLNSTVPAVKEAAVNPEHGVAARHTAFANYYGLPVATVPCGFDSHGIPIGLQIVGKPGKDRTVLNVAGQYELIAKFSSRHPIT